MGIQINGNTNNINAGIGSLSIEDLNEIDIVGVATASNFKTGSSNLHSTGLTVGNALVHSTGINVGTGATVHCPATNVLTFGTNSIERLRLDSNGVRTPDDIFINVRGKGFKTPDWIITNTTSGNGLSFSGGASSGEKLHIASDGAFTLKPHGDVAEAIRIVPAVDASTQQEFGIGLAVNSSHTHPAAKITFKEYDASDSRGDLLFYTRGVNSDSAPTERLRITSGGLVQFYGTNEQDIIHISTGNNADDTFANVRGDNEAGIRIRGGGSSNGGTIELAGGLRNTDPGIIKFSTGQAGASVERVRIASAGKVTMTTTSNNQRGLAVVAPKTQINFGTTADKGGFLMSETDGQFGISGGGYWTGSNWTAVHTGSAQIRHDGSAEIVFCTNSGLTVGNNFTPSSKLRVRATNVQLEQDIRLESKPNSTWGAGFNFGGNGQGTSSTHASCVVTNGNIHIDPRNGSYGTYLNWYSGGNGVYFGNSSSGQAGRIDSSGNMTVSGGYSGSDLRLKENIKNITGATDLIKSLVGKTYTWKKGIGLDDWNHYGLVAQEVQKVAPDLVRDNGSQFFDKDDNLVKEFDPTESDEDRKNKGLNQSLTVNYEGVTPILVEAMKELIAKVETLEAEVAALKSP